MKVLFIQGPEKTATSTITGILNCHPGIFILFENYVGQSRITKYGNQFLERYPEVRQFYRKEDDYGKPLNDIYDFLNKRETGFDYIYFGTKINSLDPGLTQKAHSHTIIYTMRDIKSWLVKESVIKIYRTDLDVVAPAIEYLEYIVKTARYSHAYRLWMEDLVEKNEEIITDLSSYLDVDLSNYTDFWWEKIGKNDASDPKSVFRLEHVHHSSKIKPEKLDTTYELKNHSFWDEVEKIFGKYFRNNGISCKPISDTQYNEDLKKISNLRNFGQLPFKKCYNYVESVRFGFSEPREILHISNNNVTGKMIGIYSRFKLKVKKIKNAIFSNVEKNKRMVLLFSFYDEFRIAFELLFFKNFY
jgi:hypothetical protein